MTSRTPGGCSGGHGFDSCRGLRFFLCPTLVSLLIISSFAKRIVTSSDSETISGLIESKDPLDFGVIGVF